MAMRAAAAAASWSLCRQTGAVVWRYDGCGGPPFDSERRGTQELLDNGNVLISEALGGRVLEVTAQFATENRLGVLQHCRGA